MKNGRKYKHLIINVALVKKSNTGDQETLKVRRRANVSFFSHVIFSRVCASILVDEYGVPLSSLLQILKKREEISITAHSFSRNRDGASHKMGLNRILVIIVIGIVKITLERRLDVRWI